jgi:hypothetical protein
VIENPYSIRPFENIFLMVRINYYRHIYKTVLNVAMTRIRLGGHVTRIGEVDLQMKF